MSETVVSLFDFTGGAVRPWAAKGYRCLCFDLQHPAGEPRIERVGNGSIEYLHWNSDTVSWSFDVEMHIRHDETVAMLFGFPPCDDLAVSGAKHFAAKRAANPRFQEFAAERAKLCATIANTLRCPYAIENPNSVLSTLWRKPDFSFNPCDFGGYLPADDEHPTWPKYIAPRDAYNKLTNLWCGKGFTLPPMKRVEPEIIVVGNKRGSRQWAYLGGSSLKTKNIRSATARGFALAVSEARA